MKLYNSLISLNFILRIISTIIDFFPFISVFLVNFDSYFEYYISYLHKKITGKNQVVLNTFSVVPSQQAITYEFSIPIENLEKSIDKIKKFLKDSYDNGRYINYRCWCRFIKKDTNTQLTLSSDYDAISYEITMNVNPNNQIIIQEFKDLIKEAAVATELEGTKRISKIQYSQHLGKTLDIDDIYSLREIKKNALNEIKKFRNKYNFQEEYGLVPSLEILLNHDDDDKDDSDIFDRMK